MSIGACEICWNGVCSCGHQYKDWSEERKLKIASAILDVEIDELREWMQTKDNGDIV